MHWVPVTNFKVLILLWKPPSLRPCLRHSTCTLCFISKIYAHYSMFSIISNINSCTVEVVYSKEQIHVYISKLSILTRLTRSADFMLDKDCRWVLMIETSVKLNPSITSAIMQSKQCIVLTRNLTNDHSNYHVIS